MSTYDFSRVHRFWLRIHSPRTHNSQVAATRATMAARREARARSSAALSGAPTRITTTGSGGLATGSSAAAFGRRSASLHGSGARTERAHRRRAMVDEDANDQLHPQPPPHRHMSPSARAGRRAAAAPVGGSPGLMAGVEAAAALRALAGDQLREMAASSGVSAAP